MEARKGAAEKKAANDVVLQISSSEAATAASGSGSGSSPKLSKAFNLELMELKPPKSNPESPTAYKPPKIPADAVLVSRRPSISKSTFAKPKSRLVESPRLGNPKPFEEKAQLSSDTISSLPHSPNVVASSPSHKANAATTPKDRLKSAPITPRTPLIKTPPGEEEEDEEEDVEEVYKVANLKARSRKKKKMKITALIEWICLVCIMGFLIFSLTVNELEKKLLWGLELWKWSVLVLVIFCGRLVTEWFINVLVFSIEKNFFLKTKVLYFVFGLKNSVQVFIWLGLILLTWVLLFNLGVKRTRRTTKVLHYITRGLASCLIAAAIWLLKNLFVKLLSSSFQNNRFFDRIQESIFHQYVLRVLSGPPLMEMAEYVGRTPSAGRLSFVNVKTEKGEEKKKAEEEVIDVDKLKKMKREKVSHWTLNGLVDVISGTGLSIISNVLESEDLYEKQKDEKITTEWEAKAAAYKIFRNIAKPDNKYVFEDDLLRFFSREEVDLVFPMFEGTAETGKFKRKALKNWLLKVYLERKSLALSLADTKTAVEELNKLVSVIVILVNIIIWLVLMGLLTTQVLVLISSQLLLVVFIFGNAAKTLFEAIIFVFVMHPFDVGDRCVIDGVQMVVEEMNILTTIFLRFDNEKIFYPNSTLATKPISNFYRSPEMSDSVLFAIDFSTSVETIAAFKSKVKAYLESKPQHWRPGHSVVIQDIADVNKMSIGLFVTHTINFQNYGDKSSRRSELVLEVKKIFEELEIKYHLLPQEVQVSYVGSATTAAPSPRL